MDANLHSTAAAHAARRTSPPSAQDHQHQCLTIVVTGAAGFIGQHIVRSLHSYCVKLFAGSLFRSSSSTSPSSIVTPRFRILAVDLCMCPLNLHGVVPVVLNLCTASDEELNTLLLSNACIVVHAAAVVDTRHNTATASLVHAVNVDVTLHLATLCKRHWSKLTNDVNDTTCPRGRFVFISSVAAMEPHVSPYGASKAEAERRLAHEIFVGDDNDTAAAASSSASLCIVRPHIVYGSDDPHGTQSILMFPSWAPIPMLGDLDVPILAVDVVQLGDRIAALALQNIVPHPVSSITSCPPLVEQWFIGQVSTMRNVARMHILKRQHAWLMPLPHLFLSVVVHAVEWVDRVILRHKKSYSLVRMLNRSVIHYLTQSEPISVSLAQGHWNVLEDRVRSLNEACAAAAVKPKTDVAADAAAVDDVLCSAVRPPFSSSTTNDTGSSSSSWLQSRVIKAATFESMSHDPSLLARFHARFATGGVGLTIVAYGAVASNGKTFPDQLCFEAANEASTMKELLVTVAQRVHAAGGQVGVQLTHAGAFSCAPTPISANNRHFNPMTYRFSRAMHREDELQLIAQYRSAVHICHSAGIDAVEVHCGHGYLLSQLIRNGREAFVMELLAEVVRASHAVGMGVLVKLNMGDDRIGDVRVIGARMKAFLDLGVDLLVPSCGHVMLDGLGMLRGQRPLSLMVKHQSSWLQRFGLVFFGPLLIPRKPYEEQFLRRDVVAAAHHANVPLSKIALIGGVHNRFEAACAIAMDGFGFVALGRALLRDPDWVKKRNKDNEAPRVCDSCNRCIVGPTMAKQPVCCETSREEGLPLDW